MTVAVKRVYLKAADSDGMRVLVDRLWPRGLTKQRAAVDLWLRNLAPSNELRKWYHANTEAWEEFRKRYFKELHGGEARKALEDLYKLAGDRKVTLLFASKNEDRNNATVLRDILGGARKPPTGTGPSASGAFRERRVARAPRR